MLIKLMAVRFTLKSDDGVLTKPTVKRKVSYYGNYIETEKFISMKYYKIAPRFLLS